MEIQQLHQLLAAGVESGASDIHFRPGARPMYRINGKLKALKYDKLKPQDTANITQHMLGRFLGKKEIDQLLEYDTSYSLPGVSRFRVNFYRQRGSMGLVLRIIPKEVPTIDDLHLPHTLKEIADYDRGLVLVTGATGSGKTSTLAAMLNHINNTRNEHIITIEDPLEFLHSDNKSTISQRELVLDTRSYVTGLRAALRQDPDVILVGEMRDSESVDIALKAAETGHMVFSTLHTTDAPKSINRLLSYFPAEEQEVARIRIAESLKANISQRMLQCADRKTRCVALEIMIVTGTIQKLIMDARPATAFLEIIEQGRDHYGTQSFDQHLMELFEAGTITKETAIHAATSPDDFQRNLIYE